MSRCCEFDRRNAVIGVLSALLVIAVAGWWREATREPPQAMPGPPPVETVEVLVASRDLTIGTGFTEGNVDSLTATKKFLKESAPADAIVTAKSELIGKRLQWFLRAGDSFKRTDLSKPLLSPFSSGDSEIMSMVFTADRIGPARIGDRVDIVVSYGEGTERKSFLLLPDMTVFAINLERDPAKQQALQEYFVSFVTTEREEKLICLANQRSCDFALRLRQRNDRRADWDYDKTFARLKALRFDDEPELPVAPPPRAVER
ncbi:MAG: hypothetical protein U0792_01995 [Gemmataceae bacterium]